MSSPVEHHLNTLIPSLNTTPTQLRFDLQIAAEREQDGVGMAVLSNGEPVVNLRGVARLAGVDHSLIVRLTADWMETPQKPRVAKIRELVRAQGADDSIAFIAVQKEGMIYHTIPSAVVMAILEYYAFEARLENGHAAKSYRLFARKGFRDFIYAQVGYNPSGAPDIAWKQFHDRVSLSYHTVPDGYFSVFKELADLYVTLIRAGANVGQKFIPDISVGQHWSKHWTSNNLDVVYAPRLKYQHNYPNYFPQSASNPQAPYCYPDEALAEFRHWIKEVYLVEKMPPYLITQVQKGQISAPIATAALDAFKPKPALPSAPPKRLNRF